MNYFIFDYGQDISLIQSFLESASLAHDQPKKTKEWFLWKFGDNPFGKTVMACAEDDGRIVGCVAYGLQNFYNKNRTIEAAISFETFVHPNYQGRGVFGKLLDLAENEAIKGGIKFLLNFPNANSLPGFQKKGWMELDIAEYWIKIKSPLKTIKNVTALRRAFKPSVSNLNELTAPSNFEHKPMGKLESVVTSNYLNWRFFTFSNGHYLVYDKENCYSIARVGYRGELKEVQVLFVNVQNENHSLKPLIKDFYDQTNCDLMSFPISNKNFLRKQLKKNFFFKVPSKTNICYKFLNKSLDIDMEELSLNAINYHTY